jgi:hypothetical protein
VQKRPGVVTCAAHHLSSARSAVGGGAADSFQALLRP